MKNNSLQVSIVIVCMNNLKNLYPCLDSIKKYTTITYETFVVAYLFSKENLDKLRKDYPWITIIESNEIRGFSENNNLALRQAKGKYCFIVNDDTEMKMPVIDVLISDFEKVKDNVACISPRTIYGDGSPQTCGRPPKTWITLLFSLLHIKKESDYKQWVNKPGLFKSYNISGAAFLIKTEIFRKIGWFDEYYFFCPEDIKVGTVLNSIGYECWVDADVYIYHYEGGSSRAKLNRTQLATTPTEVRGYIHFYTNGYILRRIIVSIVSIFTIITRLCIYLFKGMFRSKPNNDLIKAKAMLNTLRYSYGNKSPKEIFKTLYEKQIKCF